MKLIDMDHMRSQFEKMCSNEILRKQMGEFFDSEPEVSYREIVMDLSREELSDVTKIALSCIYQKLRDEESFGHDQHCLVTSMGPNEYDVVVCIVDADGGHNTGIYYDTTYWL